MHAIVPPYLLARLADAESPHLAVAAESGRATLATPRVYHPTRANLDVTVEGEALVFEGSPAPDRVISDAQHREQLPGVRVRGDDDPATGDAAVDEAFDGLGETFDFFWDAVARASIDGAGGTLAATVHYGEKYDNAFWNGERMVFGDGDGEVFTGFTGSISVIAHELGTASWSTPAASSTPGSRGRSTSRSPTCSAPSPSSTCAGRPRRRRRG